MTRKMKIEPKQQFSELTQKNFRMASTNTYLNVQKILKKKTFFFEMKNNFQKKLFQKKVISKKKVRKILTEK